MRASLKCASTKLNMRATTAAYATLMPHYYGAYFNDSLTKGCASASLYTRLPEVAGFQHTIRRRCYCVRNLYATIRATMLAKISSAGSDLRIIGLVEWRAADSPG
jgi:hypothetical protein